MLVLYLSVLWLPVRILSGSFRFPLNRMQHACPRPECANLTRPCAISADRTSIKGNNILPYGISVPRRRRNRRGYAGRDFYKQKNRLGPCGLCDISASLIGGSLLPELPMNLASAVILLCKTILYYLTKTYSI